MVFSGSYESLLKETGARVLVNYASPKGSVLGGSIPFGFKSVIIDSGVFQLQGKIRTNYDINIGGYATWLKFNLPQHPEVDGYFTFDWDGGEGDTPTRAALLKKNYEYMLAEGLKPIPIWHPTRESWERLDYYVEQSPWVALGGLVAGGYVGRAPSLLSAVKLRHPTHNFHVLGVGHSLINNLPRAIRPFSVDISTWNVPARFGNFLLRNEDGSIVERHLAGVDVEGKRISTEQLKGNYKSNAFAADTLKTSIRTLMSMEDEMQTKDSTVRPLLF